MSYGYPIFAVFSCFSYFLTHFRTPISTQNHFIFMKQPISSNFSTFLRFIKTANFNHFYHFYKVDKIKLFQLKTAVFDHFFHFFKTVKIVKIVIFVTFRQKPCKKSTFSEKSEKNAKLRKSRATADENSQPFFRLFFFIFFQKNVQLMSSLFGTFFIFSILQTFLSVLLGNRRGEILVFKKVKIFIFSKK